MRLGYRLVSVYKDGTTAVHQASYSGNTAALQVLLDYNADTSLQDSYGRSALHWCCACTSTDCLTLLLKYFPELSVCDRDGLTALMWACSLDRVEHVNFIMGAGLRTIWDDRDNEGRSAIHWCVRRSESIFCLRVMYFSINSIIAALE